MVIYYVLWTILIAASLSMSLGAFLWAHRHGQFKDQERARFLPLRGEPAPCPPGKNRAGRRETAVALAILALGASAVCVAFVLVLLRTTGGRP